MNGETIPRQREAGCCYAYSKADGSCYAIARGEYARLLEEWMAGRAFWTGQGFYGARLTLRLGDIVAVADSSPESIMGRLADIRADEHDDALEV